MIAHAPPDPYAALFRRWTLADLIADPLAMHQITTWQLDRLYRDTVHTVTLPDDPDAPQVRAQVRERLQQLRLDIARTLEIRRQLDAEDARMRPQPAQTSQDETSDADPTTDTPSDADVALRLLRGLIQLAQGHSDQDDHPSGGTRVPVGPRPIRPTPPAGRNQPPSDEIGF